jgi:glyoxylase-like metal-dependent hydrolase (beta-lactamase superfamily II)/rhodanese-related sulfurtransferase
VLFRQFVDDDLGCASYLVGDEGAGVAAVVDPAFSIEQYLEEADRQGARIVRTLETHTHADHVSGHGRLALEHGIPVAIHGEAAPEYPFEALADGGELELGDVSMRTLHAPGHRPEHCCFAVTDRSRADEPWLVLTGDSLFVGDTARPDLAVEEREGAEALFRSLARLLELADGVEVYPGHVAGSLCGVGMSSKASSTIGFERRFNHMLRFTALDEFVAESTASAGVRPPNVERLVALNRGQFVPAAAELGPASADGAIVLDVRPADSFAAGHVRGSINIPLDGNAFGTKAGFVLSPDETIAVLADSPGDAREAARRLHAVGFFDLAGYLQGAELSQRTEPVELDELERMLADDAIVLVDVRDADERDAGYIPGSRHVPYRMLRTFAGGIDGDRPVVTICSTGPRAAIAASILEAQGVDARPVLHDGVVGWQSRGNETVEFRRCGT